MSLGRGDFSQSRLDVHEVGRRAMEGGVSLGARHVLASAVAIGAGIILARTLTPAVFGVYAVVTFVTRFFASFCDVGLGAALIRKPDVEPEDLSTAFVMQQALVLLAVALLWASAGLWADFYALPEAGTMIRTLAVGFWITSLGAIPSLQLERGMRFQPLAVAELVSALGYHACAVTLALGGFGVWSFIFAAVLRGTLSAAALNLASPWRPSVRFDTARARGLVTFGLPFQLNKIVTLVKDNITPTLIAAMAGVTAVGYLNWAQSIAYLPLAFMPILARVSFPAYSRLQHDREVLRRTVEKSYRVLALALYPAAFLLIALAPEVVRLVYTDKWLPALPAFYLFAGATLWAVVSYPTLNALLALGRAKVILKLTVIWTVVVWALSVPLVYVFGYLGYAVAILIVSQLGILAVRELQRDLPVRVLRWIALPIGCSAAMAVIVRLTAPYWVGGIVSLAAVALFGIAVYGVLLAVFGGRPLVDELRPVLAVLPGRDLAAGVSRVARRPFRHLRRALYERFYHDAEREALIRDIVRSVAPRRSLEIGCGPGRLSRLDTPGAVVCSDRELGVVRRLKAKWQGASRPYHYVVTDAAALPFRAGTFDHVAVLDVLEHVPEQAQAAREIECVLAPQGSVTFFGPAENWRFPYHRWMRPLALPEDQVLEQWGHLYRGFSLEDLAQLFPHCRGEGVVRYHEGPLAFRVDVEFSRLPFALKVAFWTLGESYYRLARAIRSPGEPICLGLRLRKAHEIASPVEALHARVS